MSDPSPQTGAGLRREKRRLNESDSALCSSASSSTLVADTEERIPVEAGDDQELLPRGRSDRIDTATTDCFTKELQCIICLQLMEEPYATVCSHTFCRQCIERSLQHKRRCPKCNFPLEKPEQIFPNETLSNLVQRCLETQMQIKRMRMDVPSCSGLPSVSILKSLNDPRLDLPSIQHLIDLLCQRRIELEQDDKTLRCKLLKEFLEEMISRRNQKMDKLNREVKVLEDDLKYMQSVSSNSELSVVPSAVQLIQSLDTEAAVQSGEGPVPPYRSVSDGSTGNSASATAMTLLYRRRRMRVHFDDLEQFYLSSRSADGLSSPTSSIVDTGEHLDRFGECLTNLTQYNGFRQLAILVYNVDIHTGLNIVSSIEFDRYGEYFAIAGVTRKIKLYDYNSVLQDAVDIHYPISEMQCSSKISCVSWNPYSRGVLASSDYEGIVQLWDVLTNKCIKRFKEHEKRCWSVCFNNMDTKMMASGSDDAKVKLWSMDSDHSVGTVEAKVNVCCVQFNPASRYHLAFGSADHCVHYYDLRHPKQPLVICKGHKKAVSYVKFVNSREIVSASTDSQLRLWNVEDGYCVRVLKGHQNEKNFVGLATDGDYVACGSENNNLYVYYKELSKPILTHSFGGEVGSDRERIEADNGGDFVSAVCWKKNSNVILAANSQGTIKVLELV